MYSIKTSIPPHQRIALLAKNDEILLHVDDIQKWWQIEDKNTLHTTLKRYAQKGLLYRIHRGFYSLKPPHLIEPGLLGSKALHRFAYLSTETVLFLAGWINQSPQSITLISDVSKRFKIGDRGFISRKLKEGFLFNPTGINRITGFYQASPERALADLLHFNPHAHIDGRDHIDWSEVKNIQKEVGYPS